MNNSGTGNGVNGLTIFFGIIIWIIIFTAGYYAFSAIYHYYFPSPNLQVSLQIAFDEKNKLVISGKARESTNPVSGLATLTINREEPALSVVVLADITAGNYSSSEQKVLQTFTPDDALHVEADISVSNEGDIFSKKVNAYSNRLPDTWLTEIVMVLGIVLFGFLFYTYTGKYTKHKNRIAIGIAYAIVAVALILPFIAPLAINYYPETVEVMAKSPVGIVKVGKANDQMLDQWALNIGGIASKAKPEDEKYDIPKGIVVPLYVLILAILGGAVNMTRELPKLQHDLASVWDMDFSWSGIKSSMMFGKEQPDKPAATSSEAVQVVAEKSNIGNELLSKEDRRRNHLRGELIRQHMYLMTSPLLAIVTYYMLFMVEGLLAESIPIVVVISFAAGLLHETVVSTISEYANFYLAKLKASFEKKAKDLNIQNQNVE